MKTLYVTLRDSKSIERTIKDLEAYKDSLLSKNERFVKRLAEIGVTVAKATLANGQGDSERSAKFYLFFANANGVSTGQIIITSTPHVDDKGRKFYPHLAWEFGSGIYYNNGNTNPKASELGMGVGTFPEQKHAYDDYWWYRDNSNNLHISYGTEATMPMYKASKTIIEEINAIAREIFSE